MRRWLQVLMAVLMMPPAFAQPTVNCQQRFHRDMPPGNYSGIAPLGHGRYAVVSDKAAESGFYVFSIDIDTLTGRIRQVTNEGYKSGRRPNRDMEGVAFQPATQHVYISGETDNEIHEHTLDGTLVARHGVTLPHAPQPNRGLESLTFDAGDHTFWTTTECPLLGDSLLRLVQLDAGLKPIRQCFYEMDAPVYKRKGVDVKGVSELCALGDGRLLVLEREVFVPRRKIGAKVDVRLYETKPAKLDTLQKRLLVRFTTRMNLTRQNFANYEGLCVAHRYADGRTLLLMVSDSQNRHRGWLRDWLRTVVVQ